MPIENSTPPLTANLDQISEQLMLSHEVINVTTNNPSLNNQTTTEKSIETNQIIYQISIMKITDVLQVFETNNKSKEPNHDLPTDQKEISEHNEEKTDQENETFKVYLRFLSEYFQHQTIHLILDIFSVNRVS